MDAKSLLESKLGGRLAPNRFRIKEKNLVIKVKKNMQEEELHKDDTEAQNNKEDSVIKTTYNNETTMKPNNSNNKSKPESEVDDKEYRCNIKEEVKESQKPKNARIVDDMANYEEEANNNEDAFIEPLF